MDINICARKALDLLAQSAALRGEKRLEEALGRLEEASSIYPGFLPILVEKGIVMFESGRFEEAIACFEQILKKSGNPQVQKLRDMCLGHVLADCDRMVGECRENVEALLKRADILQRLRRNEEAVRDYNAALGIRVNEVAAIFNRRSNALLDLDRPEEALEGYSRALGFLPCNGSLLFNRANVLQKLARMDEAAADYDRALEVRPDLAEAKMERSHCRLALGDFERGFYEYESRWETAQLQAVPSGSPQPLWLGKENLAGKTILLWAEQGYGDTIQFLRYVALVARSAGKTVLRTPPGLVALAKSLDCPVSVISTNEAMPAHDFHCPLMSLPLALGTRLETIPADIPYLGADSGRVEKWRKRLGARSRPVIGLAWAGRRRHPVNHSRDMRLEMLAPLTRFDVDIISLQKEVPEEDGPALQSMPRIERFGEELSDFAETAALLENLDLVIGVDSVVAHLAGALGKPVFILLRYSGEWRWLLGRADSPWYPTARLFRQKVPGDWAGVVSEIMREVKKTVVRTKEKSLQGLIDN
ncbi:MAG: tetratricopeptide repeat-containing glycosyltransferase family protein [Syntrophobacteraceae bacterium]|nr:tetratricopeptide repeat-containing glycosyltransferase family protein [Syntrophobacteraceae bacterium]